METNSLNRYLETFRAGRELAGAETFFDLLIAETDESLLAEIFRAWNEKGISTDEVYSLADVMRRRAVKVNSNHETFVDAVGTGGSRVKTFNVSTAAAFVAAGAGAIVAKHGNRAATSSSGSADVLSALGVNPSVEAARAEFCLNEIGICFMFAPNFHRLSPVLAKVRRELGFPTVFNNLGPLCNPAGAPHQLIGVYDSSLVTKTANALARLGTKKSWIVHGSDGLDEITLNGKTFVSEISGKKVEALEISPADFGLPLASMKNLRRCSPEESAKIILQIFTGEAADEAAENLVLINAAAVIYLSGLSDNLKDAAIFARESLKNGSALKKLNDLKAATK